MNTIPSLNLNLPVWEVKIVGGLFETTYRFFEQARYEKFMALFSHEFEQKGCTVTVTKKKIGDL